MAAFDPESAWSRVLEEERRAPLPVIDSARLEAQLLDRLARAETGTPARHRNRWVPILSAAAALALLGGGAARLSRGDAHRPAEMAAASATAPAVVAGEQVPLSAPLAAVDRPLSVEHPGHARWVLSPGSVARVIRRDRVVVVRLERGSLTAEVEPRPIPETFVVEAGSVRAAVHGTRFEVAHTPDGVLVAVHEGLVAVSRGAGTAPILLPGPRSQTFGGAEALPHPATAHSGPAHSLAQHAQRPAPPNATSASGLPAEPSITAVEAGVSRVVDGVQRCFAGRTSASAEIEVSAKSTVSFRVLPDGGVRAVTFEPPLAPAVDACARSELGRLRFAQSRDGIELSRVLELRR